MEAVYSGSAGGRARSPGSPGASIPGLVCSTEMALKAALPELSAAVEMSAICTVGYGSLRSLECDWYN